MQEEDTEPNSMTAGSNWGVLSKSYAVLQCDLTVKRNY